MTDLLFFGYLILMGFIAYLILRPKQDTPKITEKPIKLKRDTLNNEFNVWWEETFGDRFHEIKETVGRRSWNACADLVEKDY